MNQHEKKRRLSKEGWPRNPLCLTEIWTKVCYNVASSSRVTSIWVMHGKWLLCYQRSWDQKFWPISSKLSDWQIFQIWNFTKLSQNRGSSFHYVQASRKATYKASWLEELQQWYSYRHVAKNAAEFQDAKVPAWENHLYFVPTMWFSTISHITMDPWVSKCHIRISAMSHVKTIVHV